MTDKRVTLAAVAGAHGMKGEVRLKLFADSVDSLARHRSFTSAALNAASLDVRDGGKSADRPLRRASPTATAAEACAARCSRSTAPRCRRSKRANIITPT